MLPREDRYNLYASCDSPAAVHMHQLSQGVLQRSPLDKQIRGHGVEGRKIRKQTSAFNVIARTRRVACMCRMR